MGERAELRVVPDGIGRRKRDEQHRESPARRTPIDRARDPAEHRKTDEYDRAGGTELTPDRREKNPH